MSLQLGPGVSLGEGVSIDLLVLPVTTGIKLYLDSGNPDSYPGTGTTWYDLSGEGYTTTLNAGVTYSASNGGIFDFGGSPTSYADVPPGFGYDYSAGFTVNIMARFALGDGAWERLIDFGNGAGVDNLILCRNSDSSTVLMSIDATNDSGLYPGEMPINWDGWAMYTMWTNGTEWRQYLNGAKYSYVANTQLPATVTRSINYIGRSNWVADAYLTGSISVIQLYNRALTDQEIQQNFNYFKGRYGL